MLDMDKVVYYLIQQEHIKKDPNIPVIFPIFNMPFKTKGNANRIKLNIKNVINPYFIIFIISPTLYQF